VPRGRESGGCRQDQENPYSLMQVFGRGHQVTRNGATVYVTRCQAAEVLPRTHTNCTNEIPAILNGTNVFVDSP
jgi:hypothetical protein